METACTSRRDAAASNRDADGDGWMDCANHLRDFAIGCRRYLEKARCVDRGGDGRERNRRACGTLERAMRAAASFGLFTESADGHFGLTDLSNVLASDTPGSVKGISSCSAVRRTKWGRLGEAIQTEAASGGRARRGIAGLPPRESARAGSIRRRDEIEQPRVAGRRARATFSGAKRVVDVAGGFGHMVVALLNKYPDLRSVLLDHPELIPVAMEENPAPEGVASRLEYVGGDMFASVPAGADVYIMKHIIHDWDDARCVTLLKNCREAMAPGGGSCASTQ